MIGGNIKVKVIDIQGNKVRLGIEAPKDVTVNRSEVQAIQDKQQQALFDSVLEK